MGEPRMSPPNNRSTLAPPGAAGPPRLLDQVSQAIRVRHLARNTERAYVHWVKRFILFHGRRHPRDMAEPEVQAFLTGLAVRDHVAGSTQNRHLPRCYSSTITYSAGRLPVWKASFTPDGRSDCRLC